MLIVLFEGLAADTAETMPVLQHGQSVRLTHPSVGCVSLDDLRRVAEVGAEKNILASRDKIRGLKCRVFLSFHGEVSDTKDTAVCVHGIGNDQCHWFFGSALGAAPKQ